MGKKHASQYANFGSLQFSKFMSVSKKDEVSAMRTLVKDCFIEGDHELVNNNFRFLFGLMGQLTDLLSPARARS